MSQNPSYKGQSAISFQSPLQHSALPFESGVFPLHLQNKYDALPGDQKQAFLAFYQNNSSKKIRKGSGASSESLIRWGEDHLPSRKANLIVMQYLNKTQPAARLPPKWYDQVSFESTQQRMKQEYMISDSGILPKSTVQFRWNDLCLPPDRQVQKDFVNRLLSDLRAVFHDIPSFEQSVRISNLTNGSLSVFIVVGFVTEAAAVTSLVIVEYMRRFFSQKASLGQAPLGVLEDVEFIPNPLNFHALRRNFPRILSLDGGGVRGILTLRMLKLIEERLRERDPAFRINDLFDWIVGTSTGAIIALLLRKGLLVQDIINHFIEFATIIFPNKGVLQKIIRFFVRETKYDAQGFEHIMNTHFNGQQRLSEVQVANEPIKSIAFVTRNYSTQTAFLVSPVNTPDLTVIMALRMSTAAPGYFPSVFYNGHEYVDGGLGCNNPTLQFLLRCTPHMRQQCVVCSIGTGRDPPNTSGLATPLLLGVSLQALEDVINTEDTHLALLAFMIEHQTYFRFQTNLIRPIGLDNCSQINNMLTMPIPEVTQEACDQMLAALLRVDWNDDVNL